MKETLTLLLFASVLLAIVGVLAASHRSKPEPQLNETSLTDPIANERKPIQSQTPESITPQAVGPIDRKVIAGGGGTSTGGSIRVEGTIGEVSATKQGAAFGRCDFATVVGTLSFVTIPAYLPGDFPIGLSRFTQSNARNVSAP